MFIAVYALSFVSGDWLCAAFSECTDPEDEIRFAGWVLDVAGIAAIIAGINTRLRSTNQGSLGAYLVENAIGFFRDMPIFKEKEAPLHSMDANVNSQGMEITAQQGHAAPGMRTIEQRLADVEDSVRGLAGRLSEDSKETNKKLGKIDDKVEQVRGQLATEVGNIKEVARQEVVRLVPKEIVGVAWIFLGITFATVPEVVLGAGSFLAGLMDHVLRFFGSLLGL
ncbi:MAG: hypothetical protein AAFQ62_05370 [Pseudomonadota bacterium]